MPALTPAQIAESRAFAIGDAVTIAPGRPWSGDWQNTLCEVVGIAFDPKRRCIDFTLRHDGDQVTDGFRATHLRIASRRPA